MQGAFQKQLLGLRQVDASQRRLGKGVSGHQSQAKHPHVVDAVYRLQNESIGLSGEVKNRLQSICKEPRRSFQSRSDAGGDLSLVPQGEPNYQTGIREAVGKNTEFARLMTCNKGLERNHLGV